MNTLLRIASDDILSTPLEFGKGELVYFSNHTLGTRVFDKILDGKLESNTAKNTSLSDVRKNLAYISDSNHLWNSKSGKENLEYYLSSIGLSSKSNTEYIERLQLDWAKKVANLDTIEKHILQLAIGLSKDPEIILYENSAAQHSLLLYQKVMAIIYDLVKDKGVTLLANISSPSLYNLYPGRIIE